jgi:hypothetical protein
MVQRRDAEGINFAQGEQYFLFAPPHRSLRLWAEHILRRRVRFLIKSSLVAFAALMAISCGASRKDAGQNELEPSEFASIEDSGARLSGDYNVAQVQDEYSAKTAQGETQTTFKFKEDGTFAVERAAKSGPVVEEGSYIISKQGDLVLYVEKAGGDQRSEARVLRYQISEQSGDSMKLRRDSSTYLILQKR